MHRRAPIVLALAAAMIGTLLNLPERTVEAAPARPDVVLFYLDDFAPYPTWLWGDASRTPQVARFAQHGLEFRNAMVSTPQCGPSRAALLTGRYGHDNGVTRNDIRHYDQAGTLSPRLRQRGYKTVFVGKYINLLAQRYPTGPAMRTLANDWSRFDVIWENQGRFYDWRQYRKSGARRFGSRPRDHSSFQAARRAVQHIRSTPAGKPLFMVVSLYDGHAPLRPLKRFEGHPACAGIAGWAGPAYDEEDVSDKPGWVQAHPRLESAAYDLRGRCESLLTVDWVIGQVRAALLERGHIGNTLQILTADNGWLMGDHRLEGKTDPYSTWVPLYMWWPRALGGHKRVITEPVSNVDLAPTICALAGCTLPDADGRSLVPLMRGKRTHLARKFLYAEMLHAGVFYRHRPTGRPAWSGVETTHGYSPTRWAYTRYQNGEEELYDLSHDPHRVRNLIRDPAYRRIRDDLRGFWRRVWIGDAVDWQVKLKPRELDR